MRRANSVFDIVKLAVCLCILLAEWLQKLVLNGMTVHGFDLKLIEVLKLVHPKMYVVETRLLQRPKGERVSGSTSGGGFSLY